MTVTNERIWDKIQWFQAAEFIKSSGGHTAKIKDWNYKIWFIKNVRFLCLTNQNCGNVWFRVFNSILYRKFIYEPFFLKIYTNASIMKIFKIKWSITSQVIKGHLSLWFLFEFLILKKLHLNVNIMKAQIFHKLKYDLKGQVRSPEALLMKFFLAHLFINRFDKIFYEN